MIIIKNIFKYIGKDNLKSIFNYLLGDIVYRGISFFIIPLYTYYLSPKEYGEVSLFLTTVNILAIIYSLGLEKALYMSFFIEKNPQKYRSNLLFLYLVNIVVFSLIIFFILDKFSIYTTYGIFLKFSIICSCIGISLMNLVYNYLNAELKSKEYSILSLIIGISILLINLFFIIILTKNKNLGRVYAMDIVYFICILIFIPKLIKKIEIKKIEKVEIIKGLSYSIPLIFHTFSSILLVQSDKIMIKKFLGIEQLGIYSLGYSLGGIIGIIISCITKVWLPFFYKNIEEKKIIKKYIIYYSFFINILILITYYFIEYFYNIVLSPEYAEGKNITKIILLSNIFIFFHSVYGNYMYYFKLNYLLAFNSLIGGGINILLNYFYLEKYGINFAAFSTIIGYLVIFILNYLELKFLKKDIINFNQIFIISSFIFYLLIKNYI